MEAAGISGVGRRIDPSTSHDAPDPQPLQGPFAFPDMVAEQPDRGPLIKAALLGGLGTALGAKLFGAGGLASVAVGAIVGGVVAGAMLLRGERVSDSDPIPEEWTVRDAADGARIMTWNIRGSAGSWGGQMRTAVRDDILDAIEQVDPDVVVMQEVDRRTPRTYGRDLAAELAEGADATDWSFAYRRTGLGEYGHLVMTRNGYEIEDDADGLDRTYSLPLTTTSGVQRIADISAIVTPDGDRFTMVGTHLSSANPTLRDQQATELARTVGMIREGIPVQGMRRGSELVQDGDLSPTIVLAGDFNAYPSTLRRPGSLEPDKLGLVDALSAVGVPLSSDPRRITHVGGSALDHLFTTPDATVSAATVLHAPRGDWDDGIRRFWPSEHTTDHDAIVADVVFGG